MFVNYVKCGGKRCEMCYWIIINILDSDIGGWMFFLVYVNFCELKLKNICLV